MSQPETQGSGEDLRSYWTRVAVLVLGVACYVGAGNQAAQSLIGGEPWSWAEMLMSTGIWGLAMAAVAGVQRAIGLFVPPDVRAGRALVRRALTEGQLPPDADAAAWRRILQGQVRDLRQTRWVVTGIVLLIVVLVTAAAVVSGNWAVGLLAVALAGFGAVPHRWLTRRAERARTLLVQLDAG